MHCDAEEVTARLPVVLARGSTPDLCGARNAALAEIGDPAFSIDASGMIEDANELAEGLVGLGRMELFGRDIESVITGLHAAVHAETGNGHDGRTHFIPSRAGACVAAGDQAMPVSVLLCPYDDGSSLAIVTSLEDGNGHVLREDDVAQIVHDLKSPLATIALETEMLEMGKAEELDRALLDRIVHRIVLNVSFLDRMISNLLDLCAFDAGRLSLHRTPVDVCELVTSVIERAVPGRDRPRMVLRMSSAATAEIDAHRIERVIGNLIANALKYGAQGSLIAIGVVADGAYVRVSVSDHGPGIAAAQQAALFGKYRRIPGSRIQEGSGLGLYVSKRIVEAHGGHIGVESAEGRGSCFYFEVPRTAAW